MYTSIKSFVHTFTEMFGDLVPQTGDVLFSYTFNVDISVKTEPNIHLNVSLETSLGLESRPSLMLTMAGAVWGTLWNQQGGKDTSTSKRHTHFKALLREK